MQQSFWEIEVCSEIYILKDCREVLNMRLFFNIILPILIRNLMPTMDEKMLEKARHLLVLYMHSVPWTRDKMFQNVTFEILS